MWEKWVSSKSRAWLVTPFTSAAALAGALPPPKRIASSAPPSCTTMSLTIFDAGSWHPAIPQAAQSNIERRIIDKALAAWQSANANSAMSSVMLTTASQARGNNSVLPVEVLCLSFKGTHNTLHRFIKEHACCPLQKPRLELEVHVEFDVAGQ